MRSVCNPHTLLVYQIQRDIHNLCYPLDYLAGTLCQNLKIHWKLLAHLGNGCFSSMQRIRLWNPGWQSLKKSNNEAWGFHEHSTIATELLKLRHMSRKAWADPLVRTPIGASGIFCSILNNPSINIFRILLLSWYFISWNVQNKPDETFLCWYY